MERSKSHLGVLIPTIALAALKPGCASQAPQVVRDQPAAAGDRESSEGYINDAQLVGWEKEGDRLQGLGDVEVVDLNELIRLSREIDAAIKIYKQNKTDKNLRGLTDLYIQFEPLWTAFLKRVELYKNAGDAYGDSNEFYVMLAGRAESEGRGADAAKYRDAARAIEAKLTRIIAKVVDPEELKKRGWILVPNYVSFLTDDTNEEFREQERFLDESIRALRELLSPFPEEPSRPAPPPEDNFWDSP